jgi:hypothetical protein
LESCSNTQSISIWSRGYYVETIPCNGDPKAEYSVTLRALNFIDNPNYQWVGADNRSNGSLNCATCHSDPDPDSGRNEYGEWTLDRHANVFVEPYFWTMYMTMNTFETADSADELGLPLADPGEKRRCLFCHAPAALPLLQQGIDWPTWNASMPGGRINVETEGITCDVCHKVNDVLLDENNFPFENQPGVLSLTFLRPPGSTPSVYFGPRPDYEPEFPENSGSNDHAAVCSTAFSEGTFCAPCHYGKFFDTVIYNSYGEWLESDYSKKEIDSAENKNYRSCQDCHMISSQAVDGSFQAERSACSQKNVSFRDFRHNMMKRDNTGSPILVQGAATVTIDVKKDEGKIKVKVTVVNERAGHKFPTDSPLRHLILVVEARDINGLLLAQLEGPRIPEWGGADNLPGGFEGQPGEIYANILRDEITGTVPAVMYWDPTVPAWKNSDTRLDPRKKISSNYSFLAPGHGDAIVTARLIYRYAFLDLILKNGWPMQDVLVNWDLETVSQ